MNSSYDPSLLVTSAPKEVRSIAEKVIFRKRLTLDEGLSLFETPHLSFLQNLADFARIRAVGDTVYYSSTLHLYPTNYCELGCPLCSFSTTPDRGNGWLLSPSMMEEKVLSTPGINEVHIVGGLWKECHLPYYSETFSRIKKANPSLHIKALTAVEIEYLSTIHGCSLKEVLTTLITNGLGSIPGGGAEILVDEVRKTIAPKKTSSDDFLSIHKLAHSLGISSNITMLFGHIEQPHHILQHLEKIRLLQDETGGFNTFVPLQFHPKNNPLGENEGLLRPKDVFRVYAISRLMLDNVANLKVLWNYTGIETAQKLLFWGVNDLGSTSLDEKVVTMAGGIQAKMTESRMCELILAARRTPKKVHSGHVVTSPSKERGSP
jgi:CofH subfamily radical SAM domain protein